METMRDYFFMYPMWSMFLFFIITPLVIIINAVTAKIISLRLRYEKGYINVLLPSLLSPFLVVIIFFIFNEFSVGFIMDSIAAMFIVTIPQMLAHYLAKKRTEAARVYISIALGCINTIALSIIVFIIGNLIGAQTN